MAIESTGPIRLRGAAGDGRTDINEEINGNATDTDVSLGTLNTTAFTNVSDGNTTTGRSMSEMRNYSAAPAFYPTTESAGALGESLTFESSQNQKVERQLSIAGSGTTATISVWLKRHESYSGRELIYFSTDITGGNNWIYGLEFQNDYLLVFPQIIYNTDADSYTKSNFKFNDFGSWYHIVIAMDTTKAAEIDRLKVYVNGDELNIDDFEYFNVPPQNTARISQVNHYQALGDRWLAGSRNINSTIGDFKYIDGQQLRPDSFGEMKNGVWVPKAFNTASTDVLVSSNLELNYQFKGNADDSANSYNGTVNGATFINNNYGSIDFDGSNDYINFTNPITTASDTSYSYSTWVNFDVVPTTGYYAIIERTSSTAIPGFLSYFYGNSSGLALSSERYAGGNQKYANNYNTGVIYPFEENKWYNITASYDSSTSKVKWYINGYEYGELTLVVKSTSRSHASGGRIGADYTGGASINGQMGELQIYSSALTATEALQNYNATKHKYTYGLNGFHLPLNNTSAGTIVDDTSLKLHLDASNSSSYSGSGTSWLDLSGNSATATLNGVNFLSTTNGGVFDFDGSNDDATIDDTKINYSNFSLEFWLNPDGSLSSSNTIFSRYSTTSSQNVWHIRGNDTNNGIEFVRYTGGGGTLLKDSTVVPVNKWTHVFITHDETNGKLKIYKNGNLDAEHSISSTLPTGSTVDLLIGNLQGYSFRYNGQMAQIRFYNDILTAQEVIQNYRATQGNYEQVSTVDISGNANNHTPTNLDYTYHTAGQPAENYVTLNPNAKPPTGTYEYQYGNLRTYSASNNFDFGTTGTIPVTSGKWYFECQFITNNGYSGTTGWLDSKDATVVHSTTYPVNSISNLSNNLQVKINSTTWVNVSSSFAANGVWSPKASIAFDADTGKLWVKKATDTTWYNSGDPAAGTNPVMTLSAADMYVMFACQGGSNRGVWWHVSEDNWDGTAPTGFKAVATHNLPNAQFDPKDLEQNKDYFKAVKYVGDGADGPLAGPWYITAGDAGGYSTKFTGRFTQSDCTYTAPAGFSYWGGSWDPNNKQGTLTFTNSNKTVEEPGGGFYVQAATTNSYSSGKYYMELVMHQIEVVVSFNNDPSVTPFTTAFHDNTLQFRNWSGIYDFSNTQISSTTFAVNDIIGIAANIDDGEFSFYKNNTLVAKNKFLPGNKIITGFKPDLVWIKNRDAAVEHRLHDSVRGQNKYLIPHANTQEQTSGANLASFDTNGFSVSGNGNAYNQKGVDYIAWCWKAGGAATTISAGTVGNTIASNVSANQDAGFSIVSYTGNGTAGATVAHGLSSIPELYITKGLSGTDPITNWKVYNDYIGNTKYLHLNSDIVATTASVWNNTSPTSSVFSLGGSLDMNGNGTNFIAYCFHSVDGFSKIGSYTGNGSSDGTFVYTGFKPAWVMIKSVTSGNTGDWIIVDNVRNSSNTLNARLDANSTMAEYTAEDLMDFYSNGFKLRTSSAGKNRNGYDFIYMAFAEDPFTTSNSVATFGDGNEFIEGGNYPEDNFAATTYTGNGGTQKIVTGVDADLVWVKSRSDVTNHMLIDSVRGFSNNGFSGESTYKHLLPNETNAEVDNATSFQYYGYVKSLDSNGFTVRFGSGNAADSYNRSGATYAAWSWKAAGNANTYNILENGTVTSSASASTLGLDTGTITPTGVSANRDNGFSIVKYNGGQSSGTKVAHGLSKPPELIIVKNISDTASWPVLTKEGYTIDANTFTLSASSKYLALNSTTNYINYVFDQQLGGTANGGLSTDQLIAYCWHSVPGFSKIGSYKGNGSSSARKIYTGFEPAFIMIKNATGVYEWTIIDNKRGGNTELYPNTSGNENSQGDVQNTTFASDGFILNAADGATNQNNATIIYMAFAHR